MTRGRSLLPTPGGEVGRRGSPCRARWRHPAPIPADEKAYRFSAPDALLPSRWTNDAAIGTQGDVYHHYVNGDRTVTALFTRWETMRDAEQFDRALLSRGKYFLRYGVHILVLAGDVDPARGAQLASVAMQGVSYWSK